MESVGHTCKANLSTYAFCLLEEAVGVCIYKAQPGKEITLFGIKHSTK